LDTALALALLPLGQSEHNDIKVFTQLHCKKAREPEEYR